MWVQRVYYTPLYLQTHMQASDPSEVELQTFMQSDEDIELGAGRFSKVCRRKVNGDIVAVKVSS